ncbi:major facilitator superfamily domain-containing protein [Gamsiella multidivaricata]|uniref:major facilitator superfamily domain-containing protein n=1 Tax=Gamsiella multidivaricata TaxID=101098 RepID=UPI0022208777|nr:major facilitator superfamily domain-containing protein [Gamsiella multidivaricata]KAI7824295.1 major facilitator superfamily domain-containing protein [Gamsiella multidivaricata]
MTSTVATERQPLLAKNQSTHSGTGTRTPLEEHHRDQDQSEDSQSIPLDEASRLAPLQALPWYRRPSVAWLLPFILLLAVVMGISQAPQEQLIVRIICKEHFRDKDTLWLQDSITHVSSLNGTSSRDNYYDDPCNTSDVQAYAALVMSRVRSLKYITGMFTIGYITSLSDRYGRKALIYITLIPTMLTQALIVYMAHPSTKLGVSILYADAVFTGVLGAGLLLEPSLNAYIVDCTSQEGRSLSMGYVMVALAVGLIAGPMLGEYLIKLTGDMTTAVMISIAIQCILILYAIVLPESLPKSIQLHNADVAAQTGGVKPATETSILIKAKNGIRAILDPLLLFLPGKIDTSSDVNVVPARYTLITLIAAYGFLQFASNGITIILIPYTNLVFHWTTLEDNIYYSLSGAASFIVYVGIFPVLKKMYKILIEKESPEVVHTSIYSPPYVGHNEISQLPDVGMSNIDVETLEDILHPPSSNADAAARSRSVQNDLSFFIFGSTMYLIGHAIVPLVETEAAVLVACCIRALASVALPSFMSLFTSYVPVHQTGKALGGICLLDTITMTVSSLLYGWVFSKSSVAMPSAVFLVSAAFASLSLLAGLIIWSTYKRKEARN